MSFFFPDVFKLKILKSMYLFNSGVKKHSAENRNKHNEFKRMQYHMILFFKIKSLAYDVFSIFSKNTALLFCSSLFYNLSQFFLILILSKVGTLEMLGQLGTALAISGPASMFFSFRLYLV